MTERQPDSGGGGCAWRSAEATGSKCLAIPSKTAMKTLRHMLIITAALALALAAASLHAAEVEKGVSAAPPNAAAIAGTYCCRDGEAYNVTLSLNTDGTYLAKGTSCLRDKGEASGAGAWKLTDRRIVLTPSQEAGWMKGEPKAFDVLKFKGDWIFVRADWPDYYNEHGVTDVSCFQRRKPENQK